MHPFLQCAEYYVILTMFGASVISYDPAHDKLGLVSKSSVTKEVGKEPAHHPFLQAPSSLDPLLETSRYSCANQVPTRKSLHSLGKLCESQHAKLSYFSLSFQTFSL